MRIRFTLSITVVCIACLALFFAGQLSASDDKTMGDPVAGETAYAQTCARCHGSGGTGGFAPRHVGCGMCGDMPALIHEIETDMPKGNAEQCVGECALDTAAFIYVKLNGNSL